jgi:hypothetical protein
MNVYEAHSTALMTIISDVLGENASRSLVGRMYSLLNEDHKDFAALQETCLKIEKLVALFHGPVKAKHMHERLKDSFSKAGFLEERSVPS